MESKGGVAAVDRAFLIIGAFTHQKPVLTLAELARQTGLYKSTILRLLGSLEKAMYIVQRSDGTYQLGPALLSLASVYQESFDLRQFVQPILENLVASSSEGASFFVREGDSQLCLFRVDGRQNIRDHHIRVGDRRGLDEGASARCFLRFSTEKGPFHMGEMAVASYGKVNPEMAAVAAPVFGQSDALVGVITLSGPVSRFTSEYVGQLSTTLVRECAALSRQLGASPGLIRGQ